ncbi:L,D-transpeptidase family protein [Novosphingobium flavum]|uniref:L,D-transpeptidase family protein n=1 Tax=Novosphingobium flavum TaxID=1778672 RepID=A0A7X1FP44_9SPHN|nr:L,D-transpeptidase family protein [Novosphingobium flavum]MBC2664355.1 L,D-transpeptidase family protein [Novosphingobium flavum]
MRISTATRRPLFRGALLLAACAALPAQAAQPTQAAQPADSPAAAKPAAASKPAATAKPAPSIKPAPVATATVRPQAGSSPAPGSTVADPVTTAATIPPPAEVKEPVMHWPLADAQALLAVINGIADEGLAPADYRPAALKAAIGIGEGDALDEVASKSFAWLAEDLRDGRTPMDARVQWFAVDKDVDVNPTDAIMTRALESHDIAGTLAALDPTYPDYAVLKAALATTPRAETKTRALIRANMDRWRWFTKDLGEYYLMTNVPEFQLRLVRRDKIVRTYKTIVGKPGKTATPQLAEEVEDIVFNPTWTVPQSIVVGEGMGAKYANNPARAAKDGYKVIKQADGTIILVQQPGPKNSLGLVKIDMPNPHAIYLHDTPARGLFATDSRAYSHGCIRTERALELGMMLAMLKAGKTPEEVTAISQSGKYTKVPLTTKMPVYVGYFTMAKDINDQLITWPDLYGRDAPVLASFAQPRQLKTGQRTSNEKVIAIDAPGA